jgi:hypothetical protein
MLKRTWVVSIVLLSMSLCAFASNTDQTDWNLLGGSISWNGSSTGDLTGSGIGVLTTMGFGTPNNNNGSLWISDGSLSFTSGAYNGTMGSTWSWGAGTITVTGCIQGVTASNCNQWNQNDNTVLFTDNFSSISITSTGELVLGQNSGTYNSAFAAYFGLPASFTDSSTDLIATWSTPGTAINWGLNLGGQLTASPAASVSVPEDWSLSLTLGLLAFALAAFAAARRLGLLRPVKS